MTRTVALLIVLCATLFGAITTASAATDEELCALGGKHDGWAPLDDPRIRASVEEFTRLADLHYTRTLVCTSESERAYVAWNVITEEQALVVGIHRRFAGEMPMHVRTIVAHEVAHGVVGGQGGNCERYSRTRMPNDHILCEHDTDRAASQWVGRDAVLAALRDTITYLNPAKMSGTQLVHTARRIQLLEWYP